MKLLAVLAALLGSAQAQCSWSLNSDNGHNEIWYTGSDGDPKVKFMRVKNDHNFYHDQSKLTIIQGSFLGTIRLCSLRWNW